jgi:hypothetical protein
MLFAFPYEPAKYTYYYSKVPPAEPVSFPSASNLPILSDLFTVNEAPLRFGVSAISDSLSDAIKEKDLCQMELEAKECALGWSVGRLMSYICNMWRVCVADADAVNDDLEKKEKTAWTALGTKQFNRSGTQPLALPEEWNNVDPLHSNRNGESSHEAGLELQGLTGERLCATGN